MVFIFFITDHTNSKYCFPRDKPIYLVLSLLWPYPDGLKIGTPLYRNVVRIELSICRIEGVLPFIPWYPRTLYGDIY